MKHFLYWLNMGGYAFYVWSSYGLLCCIFLMHGLDLLRLRAQTRKKLRQWLTYDYASRT